MGFENIFDVTGIGYARRSGNHDLPLWVAVKLSWKLRWSGWPRRSRLRLGIRAGDIFLRLPSGGVERAEYLERRDPVAGATGCDHGGEGVLWGGDGSASYAGGARYAGFCSGIEGVADYQDLFLPFDEGIGTLLSISDSLIWNSRLRSFPLRRCLGFLWALRPRLHFPPQLACF